MRIITEDEFRHELLKVLRFNSIEMVECVTGPGRSGAIAAVYTSHVIGKPFIPYGSMAGVKGCGRPLIIDTATESGATLRKAQRRYAQFRPIIIAVYHEPPRVKFWYEVNDSSSSLLAASSDPTRT